MKIRTVIILACSVALAFALTGCSKEDQYKQAVEDLEAGNYAQAAETFEKLGDFEDSAQLLTEANFGALQQFVQENGKALDDKMTGLKSGDGSFVTYIALHKDEPDKLYLYTAFTEAAPLGGTDTSDAALILTRGSDTAKAKSTGTHTNGGTYASTTTSTADGTVKLAAVKGQSGEEITITKASKVVDNSKGIGGGWTEKFDGKKTTTTYADGTTSTEDGNTAHVSYFDGSGAFSLYPQLIESVISILGDSECGITLGDIGFTNFVQDEAK